MITVYCGVFFLSAKDPESQSFDPSVDYQMTDSSRLIFLIMILFSNGAFFFTWFMKFIGIMKVSIREKYPKLYIALFLCCWKDLLMKERMNICKNEKWEKIISKIEDVQFFMKDMISKYVNNIHYEGHEDFLKLLYIIEAHTNKIDLTLKPNDLIIAGKIAEEWKFDPKNLEIQFDDKELDIENTIQDH
jgi:hypothetical protein